MTQPLTGLTGIAGMQRLTELEPQATAEERSGGTADPKHSFKGTHVRPYPWEANSTQAAFGHGPYGPQNQLLSDEYWFFEPAGMASDDPWMDNTPSKRAAPWPKGIASGPVPSEHPDDIANQLRQSADIHGIDLGASERMSHNVDAVQDEWIGLYEVNPGHSDQVPLPKQAISSGFMWGTRDRVQSMAAQNGYGYDSKHQMRRFATGSIPGNTMWMRPGGRPLVKSLAGPARPPIGADSPFSGDNLGASFDINGAYLQNVPAEYVPPPTPNLAPGTPVAMSGSDAIVEWY